jgi:voltage-gated potassium channel
MRPLRVSFVVLITLTAIGAIGFRTVVDLSWIDAFYMSVTTLSTVGYGEVRPLGPSGRLFATLFIVVGVGATLYTVVAVAEFAIAGRIGELLGRRVMERALVSLRDHVIVCGHGRLGRALVEQLTRAQVAYVVVDEDPAATARIEGGAAPVLCASADDEGLLERAGITRARAFVAATGSEAVNIFIALAAREANPSISIHARAETEVGARRLRNAGATQIVSPHRLGGQRIANAILRPAVVDFMELATPGSGVEIDLEEVAVAAGSELASMPVGALAEHGVRVSVVAIKRDAQPLLLNPQADVEIRAGDRVVVVGDRNAVNRLAEFASNGARNR